MWTDKLGLVGYGKETLPLALLMANTLSNGYPK